MADALRFALPRDRIHPAFNALDQELASRGEGLQQEDGEGFRLNIVNAVWGQQDHPFREPFLDFQAGSYGAGVRQADFREMPEESRLAINRFYRADPSRSRGTGGTRLGLTVARRLVEAHGGSIEAESVVGQGSRFIIRLPDGRPGR